MYISGINLQPNEHKGPIMHAVFSDSCITFHRNKSDPRFHGTRFARANMRSCTASPVAECPWLRCRREAGTENRASHRDQFRAVHPLPQPRIDMPHIYIWSGFYALYGANEDLE